MNTQETIGLFEKYVIGNYGRVPIVIVRGAGSRVWDADGREYIDFFPGWAVNGLGHCPSRVVERVREQLGNLLHVPNTFYMEPQGLLAEKISTSSFGGKSFFCNSGTEANEAAIKLARLYGNTKGRNRIITMLDSFHGRTYASVAATGQPKYHKGFDPMVPGFEHVPFNDFAALEAAFDDQTCAVMLEPVQGEGGINVASREYMQQIRQLCDSNNALLIVDEVQTGMGRTGAMFGYMHFEVEPDIMTLAKTLGGGIAIGAMVARPALSEYLKPGTHASTFGGNPVAASAALGVFETIEAEDLCSQAVTRGTQVRKRLEPLVERTEWMREIRGLGLMLGIELTVPGQPVVDACLDAGLIVNCTHETILRIMPAMTVDTETLEAGLDIFCSIIEGYQP